MSAATDFDLSILEFFSDDPLTVVYVQQGAAVFDPVTGANMFIDVSTNVKAILLDFTKIDSGLSSKFGTQIIAGDKDIYVLPPEKVDINATPLTINTTSDVIKIGTTQYNVVAMKELNPTATSPLLYNFHIRR